jgi:hypothetical protein
MGWLPVGARDRRRTAARLRCARQGRTLWDSACRFSAARERRETPSARRIPTSRRRRTAELWFVPVVNPDGSGVGGEVEYVYAILTPTVMRFHKTMPGGKVFSIMMTTCPVTETETLAYMLIARNYDIPKDPAALHEIDQSMVDFQDLLVKQDAHTIEHQRPELLPLDWAEELHLAGFDAMALAYRRWLRLKAEAAPD